MNALVHVYSPLNDKGPSTSKLYNEDDGGSELRPPFQGRVELAVGLSQWPHPRLPLWQLAEPPPLRGTTPSFLLECSPGRVKHGAATESRVVVPPAPCCHCRHNPLLCHHSLTWLWGRPLSPPPSLASCGQPRTA